MSPVGGVPDLLLVRGDDLLIAGVSFDRFRVESGADGQPTLFAEDGARVQLTLPPQAVAEERVSTPSKLGLRRARSSGPSIVTFTVPPGSALPATAEGILGGLADVVFADPQLATLTAIELPWHLFIAPAPRSGGQVLADHPALPIESESGVVGLWLSRLRAAVGDSSDAQLGLQPLDAFPDEPGLDFSPPSQGDRLDIFNRPEGLLAQARRLELSALGGSLSARLFSTSFDWEQDTTLGRDQRVRTVSRGVLYPFGHRAELEVTATRVFDPSGTPTLAVMHRDSRLVVTEPVRTLTDGPGELVRGFPFSEVEILTRSFTGLGRQLFTTEPRVVHPGLDLSLELRQKSDELAEKLSTLNDVFLTEAALTFDDFVNREPPLGSSATWHERRGLADLDHRDMQRERDDLLLSKRQKQDLITILSTPPQGPPDEPPPPISDEVNETINQLVAEIAEINQILATRLSEANIARVRDEEQLRDAQFAEIDAIVQAEFESQNTLEEFIVLRVDFDPDARRVGELRGEMARLQERIDLIANAKPEDVFWTPTGADGQQLQFTLRCAGTQGDVFIRTPLVFVKDRTLPATENFVEFSTLDNPTVAGRLAGEWAGLPHRGVLPVPGVRIDLIRSDGTAPAPGDVHEVHAMTLTAAPVADGFRPKLSDLLVELPALRTLFPEKESRRAIHFAREFLEGEGVPDIALKPNVPIDVSFLDRADRSGGLVSPKFDADGISRQLGPVALKALDPVVSGLAQIDMEEAYKGATLLGFPLASLIKRPPEVPELPAPPTIVQLFDGNVPNGMHMAWTLPLRTQGPFRPTDTSKLVLTVEATLTKRETTCTVNDFSLVLPPGGLLDGVLTLTFRSVSFTQTEGRPPDLDIQGLTVGFGGDLRLLQELQLELQKLIDLPGNRPTVEVTENGIRAGYGIAVPSVPAGGFLIRNVAIHAAVDVPFKGDPVTVTLSFATRANPFTVTVIALGGGGYLDMTLGPEGLMRLEASLEFGAAIEVDLIVARGEVHAMGGVRFTGSGGSISIDGYIRIGGSVEVLGLVSVSIELLVTLTYDGATNRLFGRATLIIEIDLTLYSDSIEIDSGLWELAGTAPRPIDAPISAERETQGRTPFEEWQRYRKAFASS